MYGIQSWVVGAGNSVADATKTLTSKPDVRLRSESEKELQGGFLCCQ
jgi:hypothetical protein